MQKWLLALSILAILGTVTGFEATMQPVEREATPEDPALFQVTVTNTGDQAERYSISEQFTKSGWIYYDRPKTIQPGETATFNITINPGQDAIQQSHSFKIYVTGSVSGSTTTFTDYMSVKRKHRLNVKDFTVNGESFRPGETVETSITVQNLVPEIVSDYRFTSTFNGEQKNQEGEPFAPGALKTYSFSHEIPVSSSPGNETLNLSLTHEGGVQSRTANINIQEIQNITRQSSETDRIFYRSGNLVIGNYGNSPVNMTENMSFNSYLDPILMFEPAPDTIVDSDSRNTYIWDLELEPGETQELGYRVNYWMPLGLAAAILLGIVVLRNLTGNVKLTKKVEEKENGELKVSIEIVNRSNQPKNTIDIKDFVPNVADLDEDFDIAKPDLKKTTDGVEMEWSLEDFKPGEKRVIHYRVEPKVEIEEGIELPSAELVEDGKTVSRSTRK